MNTLIRIERITVFAVLFSLLFACSNQQQGTLEKSENSADKIQKVAVVFPQRRSFIAEISITGIAQPDQVVMLYAMESGVLTKITKDIGDRVRQGQVIGVLENPELSQQKIKWEADFQVKKANYKRLHTVYKKTPALTNIQMVENAEAEYLAAKTNLDVIEKRIGFLTIKAPFAGVITKRLVDQGAMIQNALHQNNAQAIVEIQDINPIRLTIAVPESDAITISKGMKATVTFPELSGETRQARISRTAHALDQQSHTMQVEIDLENTDGKLISGMYANILLHINSSKSLLSLPVMAKTSYKNEDYILVVADKIVQRVKIKEGLSDSHYFEVIYPKITLKTAVIVEGKGLVSPGKMVKPVLKSVQ